MEKQRLVRGFQWDLARQMEKVEFLLDMIPKYAAWGYDEIYLYLEDAFDYPSVPGVGRKWALTSQDMEKLTRTADAHGMKIIPVVPLMGHTGYLMKTPALMQLAEKQDESGNPLQCGQICPLHSETPKLAEKLLRDVAPYCTAGIVHVGLDESFEIGTCTKCREEVKRIGLARHFVNHILRLHEVCSGLGLRMGMWGDMLYYMLDAIPLLPKDIVVYDWFYYPFKRLPKVELYNFAEVDLTGLLVDAGIDVYGCPNSGPFNKEPITPFLDRLENVISWWRYCQAKKAKGIMVTSWCSARTSPELNTLVDASAASLWLNPGEMEPGKMLEQGVCRAWGKRKSSVAKIVGMVEKYQYAGYYRWQTYDNWRALANGDSSAPFMLEEKHFRNLIRQVETVETSVPFVNILNVRHYVAQKDLFLSENSSRIFSARKLLERNKTAQALTVLQQIQASAVELLTANRKALKSTRAVWRRSRPMTEPNPTEQMIKADQVKLAELGRFIKRAKKDPSLLWKDNPLTGQWQLLFWVRTVEPALQGTVVQMTDENGVWKNIHTVWSLEFIAEAGNAKADFKRHHAVAVEWDGLKTLELRLGVRGFGRLEIYDLCLTNGVRTIMPQNIVTGGGIIKNLKELLKQDGAHAVFGVPAPKEGFPPIDWSANQCWADMSFTRIVIG
jgi:hypothetical protein